MIVSNKLWYFKKNYTDLVYPGQTLIDTIPDEVCSPAGQCEEFFAGDHSLNCHIGYCADECTTKDDMKLQFQLARNNCEDEEAGAVLMIGGKQYEFTNDADFDPPSRVKRGARARVHHRSIAKRQAEGVSARFP